MPFADEFTPPAQLAPSTPPPGAPPEASVLDPSLFTATGTCAGAYDGKPVVWGEPINRAEDGTPTYKLQCPITSRVIGRITA